MFIAGDEWEGEGVVSSSIEFSDPVESALSSSKSSTAVELSIVTSK